MQLKDIYEQQILTSVRRLNDIRFAGQVLFVVIILLVSWSGIKAIQTNYGLQKQISALNQQNSVQKLENTNLELQNQYFKSRQYLELAARQNFGLANPGEKMVVVPRSVALSYTTDVPVDEKETISTPHQSAVQRHINDWIDFFLHQQGAH
jgi:cell division protein FtsB